MTESQKEKKGRFKRIGLPLAIIAVAGLLAFFLIITKEPPQQSSAKEKASLVETITVHRETYEISVSASGSVQPSNQVSLRPQVSGHITEVHPRMIPGGIVRKGTVLARIDARPYEQAYEEGKAALAQARAELKLEQGRQEVAEADWRYFQENSETEVEGVPALALRKPQLERARAQVQSARARVEQALLNLEYTTIKAPFDAAVLEENVDPGQFAGPQAAIATLVGIHNFRARVSLPVRKLAYIDIPQQNAEKGSEVHIRQTAGEDVIRREGRVARLLPKLGEAGRMAQLIIDIPDPLRLQNQGDEAGNEDIVRMLPLLINA